MRHSVARQCSATGLLLRLGHLAQVRRTQEGCGGLGGENPAAFPKARPIFQQLFSLPESAQTLPGIAFRAAGKSGKNFQQRRNLPENLFQQGISDSYSLFEFSDQGSTQSLWLQVWQSKHVWCLWQWVC